VTQTTRVEDLQRCKSDADRQQEYEQMRLVIHSAGVGFDFLFSVQLDTINLAQFGKI
jgi:hypothetical protein